MARMVSVAKSLMLSGGSPNPNFVKIRNILQLNGTSQYMTLNEPIVLAIGESISITAATYRKFTVQHLINDAVVIDVGSLVQLTGCTLEIDGVTVADGVSVAGYIDGKPHVYTITATAEITITYFGRATAATGYWAGHILDAETATVHYRIDSGSTTTQYAVGEASPSTKYLTLVNITAAAWNSYRWDATSGEWIWRAGLSGATVFVGTTSADTPISYSNTISGTTWRYNPFGLAVATSTLANPTAVEVGRKIQYEIDNVSSTTVLLITGGKLFGTLPSPTLFPALLAFQMFGNYLSGYPGGSIATTVSSIILNDNLLTVNDVDGILSDTAASQALSARTGTLNLAAPGNAAPTGGATNADYVYLTTHPTNPWTVTIAP